MEARTIIASTVKSSRSNNMVWAVQITGIQGTFAYCKSALSAMKCMFLLKSRTGLDISNNIIERLSHEIAEQKRAKAKKMQEHIIKIAVTHDVNNVLSGKVPSLSKEEKPKAKRRTRSTKKVAASV